MNGGAAQLPFVSGKAEKKATHRFRKQLLPVGEIEHPVAGTVKFDLSELERNFKAGAYDQVPFLLANEKNEHHDDPERFRGKVEDVELAADGLYGIIETTDRGASLLEENPGLPVSVRVKRPEVGPFKGQATLAHVLGTLDPVAKGMAGWELIEASSGQKVTDLSGGAFSFSTVSKDAQVPGKEAPEFSKEDLAKFRAFLDAQEDAGGDAPKEGDQPKQPAAQGDQPKDGELTDEQAEAIVAGLLEEAGAEPATEPGKEPVVAHLSEEDRRVVDLATQTAKTAVTELSEVQKERAKERFAADSKAYADAGVPPALIECAAPVLSSHDDTTIDFANAEGKTEKVSARKVVTDMLDAAKGFVDFSEAGSLATLVDDENADDEAKQRRKDAEAAAKEYGAS